MKRIMIVGLFLFSVFVFLMAGDYQELQKLVASDRAHDDNFGFSVAISGDFAIVGSRNEGEDTSDNYPPSGAGSAYIFKWNGTNWNQETKLVASDREDSDHFGHSVSISGNSAIVGANWEDEDTSGNNYQSAAGSVYIFRWDSTSWNQETKLVASDRARDDHFGESVSISGNYAIVGAYREDEDSFGNNTLSDAGSVYIFKWDGSYWSQETKLVASDRAIGNDFGYSVSISGDYAIVGARYNSQDASGNNTLPSTGAAYIFKRNGSSWSQEAKLVASDRGQWDNFGCSVSISGNYALIGALNEDEDILGNNTISNAGAAYIFKRDGTNWSQEAKLVASNRAYDDFFGCSVSISGDYAIIGTVYEDENVLENTTISNAGAAYIFKRDGTNWSQEAKLVASDRAKDDHFGESVSISSDYAIVGANYEDEDSLGNNTQSGAGSVYIFNMPISEVSTINIPYVFLLYTNYPNPFNPTTTIGYDVYADSDVKLDIYNISGQLVENLANGYHQAGHYKVKWDASKYSSGIYIYRLEYLEKHISRKMLLIK